MKNCCRILIVLLVATLVAPAFAEGPDGKALYQSKCAMCHGADGVAKVMAKGSRNLNSPEFQKTSAEDITKLVTDGKNKMPAFKEKLKPEEVQAIATYVKTLH